MKGICHISSIALRKDAAHSSEMVSQLIYGETYTVLEQLNKDWLRVVSDYDEYPGYIPFNQFFEFIPGDKPLLYTGVLSQTNTNTLISKGAVIWNKDDISGQDETDFLEFPLKVNDDKWMEQVFFHSSSMLHTSYLWGGRSIFGIDCSGFAQIVFKVTGKRLPRDASMQEKLGESISLSQARTGDLAFFSNKDGKVNHVGILLDNNTIIHSSGMVRMDAINSFGIINLDSGNKTHDLCSIKRV
ncbi:MAG: C40 family peptidase [Flavobacteriales bacterium]|nr:C40 family peptidase [Flavobacteriales bacterium]